MKIKIKDIIGKKFNRLTVLKYEDGYRVLCLCDCGTKKSIYRGSVIRGITKSCGCLLREKVSARAKILFKTHGMSQDRFYHIWCGMNQRCTDKNSASYPRYGGRGITIQRDWMDFMNFKNDMYDSYVLHCKEFGEKQTSINRVNNDGNYELSNCRWATRKEQGNNTSSNKIISYRGVTLTLVQWSDKLNIPYSVLHERIQIYNWNLKKAFQTPVGERDYFSYGKLKKEEVIEIIKLCKKGDHSYRSIGRRFDVNHHTISKIANDKNWIRV